MEFGNLSAAWWGLLAVPIILLYILKVRQRRQRVATVLFWDQVFQESRPRAAWRQLRHVSSLLVQLVLLALLVAALVEPSFSWKPAQAQRIILVVDHSASMNATDALPTRLQRAKGEGRRLVRGLRQHDQMAIIAAGGAPQVRCGLTSHQATLNEALAELRPSDGPNGVEQAVQVARSLIDEHPDGKIVVISDGCLEVSPQLRDAKDIQWLLVGGPQENLGITQFQTRRSPVDPLGYQTLVEVQNFGTRPIAARLELRLDDQLIDVFPLRLEPQQRWTQLIEQTSPSGGTLQARLRPQARSDSNELARSGEAVERDAAADGVRAGGAVDWSDRFAADDQALALLPPRVRQPVVLVTDDSLFLQRAFEATGLVDLTVTDQIPDTARMSPGTIVVYDGRAPRQIPAGRVMVVAPEASSDLWQVGPLLPEPVVARQRSDSPLMTHVRLDSENVQLPEARQLRFNAEHQVLAATISGDPIYAAIQTPDRKVLVLTVNLAKGDLPLRTAFPIMVTNAIRWFQGEHGELRPAIAAGSTVQVDMIGLLDQWQRNRVGQLTESDLLIESDQPIQLEAATRAGSEDGVRLLLRSPSGTTRPLPVDVPRMGSTTGAVATVGPLDECGIWTIEPVGTPARAAAARKQDPIVVGAAGLDAGSGQTGPTLQIACNLANPRESNLQPAELPMSPGTAKLLSLGGRPAWFYLTLAALVVFPLEWYLYQRRWIG